MADFHFLRPLWLLLLLALPALYLARHKLHQADSGWSRYIPRPLLQPLLRKPGHGAVAGARRSPLLPLNLALVILAIGLAGPSWRQAPTPLKQPADSLVIVLDLSLSMLATDSEPDRLTLAKRKVRDILAQRSGGLTALLVYSGDAHTVTPLTEDYRTIEAMLGVLDPAIMPAQGNRADLAISRAVELLEQGAPGRGRILLISDDVPQRHHSAIGNRLAGTGYALSTLVVGTPEGGPIPLAKRGFLRNNGDIVIARANPDALASLARANGGRSHELTLGDADIRALALEPGADDGWAESEDGQTLNRWQDDGYWLLWLALPLLLLGWRRGAFAVVALTLLPLATAPRPAMALDWGGLWQRDDQRGRELIEQNPERAAEVLEQPGWKGSALYRSGRHEEAARAFEQVPGATGHYNRGNALARAGQLEQALDAYQQALAQNPDFADARFNRDLVQQLLEQQQEQEQQQQQNRQGDSGQQQSDSNQPSGEGAQPGQDSQDDQDGNSDQGDPSDQGQGRQQDSGQPDDTGDSGQAGQDSQPEDSEATQQAGQGQPSEQEPAGNGQAAEAPAGISEQPLDQGQEQWLRRIPDNPGGLLQRKFLQQYQQRQIQPDEGDTPW
jgi:Ca-activated chloride channel family protein